MPHPIKGIVSFCRVIALIPDESEDMWHAFNLISEGDSVTASTVRKVQTESATGSSTSNRVRTTLTIQVETIDFDTQACVLRLKGRNIVENQYVKVKFSTVTIIVRLADLDLRDVCLLFLTKLSTAHRTPRFAVCTVLYICNFTTDHTQLI